MKSADAKNQRVAPVAPALVALAPAPVAPAPVVPAPVAGARDIRRSP